MTRSRRIKLGTGSPDTEWMSEALCRETDPDLFFPGTNVPIAQEAQVKRICAACDVRAQCLKFALDTREPEGIWAGTTPRQRVNMLRRRA
jgi:WhiB family redox-sensing transcriptional regulator